jgi:hypothetical protein
VAGQVDLEQRFLASLIDKGLEGYKRLPLAFRATVFSVSPYQDVFRIVELLAENGEPVNFTSVARRAPHKLQGEVTMLFGSVLVESYLTDEELEKAAHDLIRRAEMKAPAKATSPSK